MIYTHETLRALKAAGPWVQTALLEPYVDAWQTQNDNNERVKEVLRNRLEKQHDGTDAVWNEKHEVMKQLAAAKDDLHQIEQATRMVMEERCPSDERHCTCVPLLRKQLEPADKWRLALEGIKRWADAYPLDIFPEPDFKKAHQLLVAGGMTLDGISASSMRHVVEGVGKIASDALAAEGEKPNG